MSGGTYTITWDDSDGQHTVTGLDAETAAACAGDSKPPPLHILRRGADGVLRDTETGLLWHDQEQDTLSLKRSRP